MNRSGMYAMCARQPSKMSDLRCLPCVLPLELHRCTFALGKILCLFCLCLLDLMRHRRGIPFVTLLRAPRSNWGFHAGKGKERNARKCSPWTCCCDVGDILHASPFYCLGSALFVSCCLEEELTVVGNAAKTETLQWSHLVLGQTPFCK